MCKVLTSRFQWSRSDCFKDSLPNFNYGYRYPNATAQLMTATRTVNMGSLAVVSVFVDHTTAHQGGQRQQPGQHH